MGSIYALIHPVTGLVHYVGQTSRSAPERLAQHLRGQGGKRKVHEWVAALQALGMIPRMQVLATADTKDALDRAEVFWIQRMHCREQPLLNATSGGAGRPA